MIKIRQTPENNFSSESMELEEDRQGEKPILNALVYYNKI